tara:strand:+ start:1980 stop:2234 length:255 start_codon:yes stop_codon:yes gene_type:complete
MCLGGMGSTKVKMPKPPELRPPLPPPPPPKPPTPVAKTLQPVDQKADIRIGAAKKSPSTQRDRNVGRKTGKQTLSIGDNQGLTL